MPLSITIIGGGITGLAAAYYVRKEAQARGQSVRCTVLEAEGRSGGKIITESPHAFVVEGGPDSFITEKPWALTLCHELGLAQELIPANEQQKTVYIQRHGRMIPFPDGFRLTVPTQVRPFLFSRLFSPWGKLRMGMDLFVPPRREESDESLASFIRRRLGEEALDRVAAPLLSGIFVSDPERLSMQSAFPRLLAMEREHGSLIRAMRAARLRPPLSYSNLAAGPSLFNSLRRGMGSLVEALANTLEADLRLQARVAAIQKSGDRFLLGLEDGTRQEADRVLLAVPAHAAGDMLSGLHPGLSAHLKTIRFVSTTTVSCAYLQEDISADRTPNGYGVLIPASEKARIMAATWSSIKFRHRAPSDAVLLRAFAGGHRDEDAAALPDDQLLALVTNEFKRLFGIHRAPMLHRIFRWPRANPQYDVGHLDRVSAIEKLAGDIPGLYLAGSSYRGVGIPDCVHSAHQAAKHLLN